VAAQTYGSTGTRTATSPRVNLLPPEIAERTKVRKAQLAMMGTGLAAVAVVGVMYTNASAKVSEAEQTKTEAVASNAKLRTELAKLGNVTQTRQQVADMNKTLAMAMHDEVRWSTYLNDLTLRIPENVWVTQMTLKMEAAKTSVGAADTGPVVDPGIGTLTFKGRAFAHDDVASWLESLSKQKGYADAYFTRSELVEKGAIVEYDSTVQLNEKALSNRYAKGLPE
jgi:Tfp pilus assembly protein PilN